MQANSIVIFCGIALLLITLQVLGGLSLLLNVYSLLAVTSLMLWRNRKSINIILKTLPRDVRFIYRASCIFKCINVVKKEDWSLVELFKENAYRNPQKICFYFEDEKWTLKDVDEFSNQVANVFQAAGYRKGDSVALLMGNSAVYVCMWLGLAKLGVITALINNNLRLQSLIHSLRAGQAKSIIFSAEFSAAVEDVAQELQGIEKYQYGGVVIDGAQALHTSILKSSKEPPVEKDALRSQDRVIYLYTSGTTGLPKAVIVTNAKCCTWLYVITMGLDIRESDVMYNPLPTYHAVGGVIAIVPALIKGISVVIKRKFSASQYWLDCVQYRCTVGLYIGEMCRFLLAQPARPDDSQHGIRLLFGVGMKPTVWEEFVERFKVPQIGEMYGGTEANVVLSEPGTFVGIITATQKFAGYVSGDKDNKKKILNDVFKHGDRAFWSEDLLVADQLGYVFFKDRLGDTFRWKGENVSAAEVEGLISKVTGNLDVAVYGVEVGNLEGRAGMATIVDPTGQLSLDHLAQEVDRCLPSYARPLFIRIAKKVDLTGTFKVKKVEHQREGFDPNVVKDALYCRQGQAFVPLTQELHQGLLDGRIRV